MSSAHINRQAVTVFLNGPVQERLRQIAEEIRHQAQIEAPVATGDLAHSGRVSRATTAPSGPGIRGEGVKIEFSSPHALFVHQGTGPAHIPSGRSRYFPALRTGPGGLVHWAQGKGLPPGAVAKGIFLHGTPANPFLLRAIEGVLRKYNLRITGGGT